jgi:hypothetical protein
LIVVQHLFQQLHSLVVAVEVVVYLMDVVVVLDQEVVEQVEQEDPMLEQVVLERPILVVAVVAVVMVHQVEAQEDLVL